MRTAIIFVPIAVLACLSLAACNEQSSKQAAAVATEPIPALPTAPQEPAFHAVDLNATVLDLRRVSLPPEELVGAVVRFNPWKDKYEKDVEFAKRMDGLNGKPLLDGIKFDDSIALRVPKASLVYDANKEELRYVVSPGKVGLSYSYVPVYDGALPSDRGASHRDYFARRAMDVDFRKQVLVQITALKDYSELVGVFKAKPEAARQLEGAMVVLLIGKIRASGTSVDNQTFPTAENREMVFKDALGFKLEGVWLVDSRNGHVLSKTWKVRKI